MSALGILKFIGKAVLLIAEVTGYVIGTFIVFFLCSLSMQQIVKINLFTEIAVSTIVYAVSYLFIYFFCPKNSKLAVATIWTLWHGGSLCCVIYWYGKLTYHILILIPMIIGYYILWRTRKKETLIYCNSKYSTLIGEIIGGILFMLLVLKIFIVIFKI